MPGLYLKLIPFAVLIKSKQIPIKLVGLFRGPIVSFTLRSFTCNIFCSSCVDLPCKIQSKIAHLILFLFSSVIRGVVVVNLALIFAIIFVICLVLLAVFNSSYISFLLGALTIFI